MPSNYPTNKDTFTNPASTDLLSDPDHAQQHEDINDAMAAVQDAIGTSPALGRADVAALLTELVGRFSEDQSLHAMDPVTTSIAIDFNIDDQAITESTRRHRTVVLVGHTTFTTSNLASGRWLEIYIFTGGATRNLTWPAGWTFIGSAAPTALASGKVARLRMFSSTFADNGVIAEWTVQP